MKLKSLFTLFIVLFCICVSVSVFAQSSTSKEFDNVEKFLSQLDIIEGIEKKADDKINRAEFVAMTVRAMNMDAQEMIGTDFTDLEDNVFASEIYMAKNLGLTNGTSASTFSPDGDVSAQVAAKMLVTALGYGQKAQALGGYPTGYFRLASSLGIFKGMENTEGPMTVKDAYVCVFNALLADTTIFKSISDDTIEVEQVSGRNLLTENFGLTLLRGIITTAGYYSVNPEYADKDIIEISGKVLTMENVPREYLGYTAEVWYDADNDKVRAVSVDDINNTVKIEAKDVIDYSDYRLRVYNGLSKEVKYSFDKGLTFVQNGRVIAHNSSSFKFDEGTLTLIDNDGDGSFEYVIAEKIDYFRISAINKTAIYDANSVHKCIDFETDNYGYEIEINGVKASVQELQMDMVCEVMMSEDSEVCLVRTNGVSELAGVVEEISQEQLFINGTAYDLNSYFKSLGLKVSPGASYSFLLAPNGSITAISGVVTEDIDYGYLLGYNSEKTLSMSPQIKILSSSNQIQIFDLADKIRLNGVGAVKNTDSALSSLLKNGEYPAYQVIRYKLTDGKVTMIDTEEIASSDWEAVGNSYSEENSLTKYVDRVSVNYRSNIGFGVPNVSFKGSIIFSVPKALTSNADAYYDDDFFSTVSTASLVNNTNYTADAYDFDENYLPAVTVVYNSTGGKTTDTPLETTAAYMVYQVTDAANPDGEITKLVKGYSAGTYSEFYIEPNVYDTLVSDGKIPSPGDVVRFTFNAKGYINGIGLDIDYNEKTDSITIAYGEDRVGKISYDYLGYFSGRALTQTGGYLTIKADNPPDKSVANSSNIVNLVINPSARYVLYNKKTNKVGIGSSADIVTAVQGVSEHATLVACKATYYYVNTIFIYVD